MHGVKDVTVVVGVGCGVGGVAIVCVVGIVRWSLVFVLLVCYILTWLRSSIT